MFFPVSSKISRKRDRQLGNHSLFTVGLEGRDGGEEGVGERGGWGLNRELPAGPIAGGQGRC